MKNTKKRLLKVIALVISIISFTLFMCGIANAEEQVRVSDSGHGTSYHSSGSHHSSSHSSSSSSRSSSRSSSSYSSSSSSGHGGSSSRASAAAALTTFVVILLFVFVPSFVSGLGRSSKPKPIKADDTRVVAKVKETLPNFDKQEFLNNGYKIYVDVQNAWMNFKLDDVRNVITDEMYNMYSAQLDLMQTKGEQNIMSDFKERSSFLKNVSVQNGTIAITAVYVVDFYDYVINQQSGKVLRGSKSKKLRITYELTYRKNIDEKAVIDKCPNCGGEIDHASQATTCKYCGSKLVLDNSNWILTNKKNLYQDWA